MEKEIYTVDAFSEVDFGGNPAGVVLDATGLDEKQMLKIAKEMNLSETAFIFPSDDDTADYTIRFFTPTQEVDLCGHATIASFFLLGTKGLIKSDNGIKIVRQKTNAGVLPVELHFNDSRVEKVLMTQTKPKFISKIKIIDDLAKIMGLNIDHIGVENFDLVPEIVSTGLKDIIVPVKSLKVLKSISPNYEMIKKYCKELCVVGIHAFTLETEEKYSTVSCRNFAPLVGIDEEAATGTSNGALGAYLVNNNVVKYENSITIVSEQGYYMGRPSKILVKIEGPKNDYTVKVGGRAVIK
ncbi:PhzF family phenazine biosynthesis protein [Alkaliphilus sp. B6464]|uniref:PhzF family phenazine biosynthesis protein n=1 Tax=Alkaliphilus sp. B6464 TaxID=2731219 RepID=UPI001BA5196C|nr:PhzF family phenazine biosynthesis protein [Alkaliphilus sp. B6464]QUH18776.1 PhzF family phenazine biosynthesis protein [Alkaliphilus sp. B6464]